MAKNTIGIPVPALYLLMLSGCDQLVSQGNATNIKPEQSKHHPEAIYGFEVKPDKLQFKVKSTGCTQPDHFALSLQKTGEDGYSATLIRQNPDRCKAMPKLISVPIPLDIPLSNKARLRVNNPFMMNSNNGK